VDRRVRRVALLDQKLYAHCGGAGAEWGGIYGRDVAPHVTLLWTLAADRTVWTAL